MSLGPLNKRYRPSSASFADLQRENTFSQKQRIVESNNAAAVKPSLVPNPKTIIVVVVVVVIIGAIVAAAVVLVQKGKTENNSSNRNGNEEQVEITTSMPSAITNSSLNTESTVSISNRSSAGTHTQQPSSSSSTSIPTSIMSTSVYTPGSGLWSNWGRWTSCAVTCGTGIQTRYRECQRNGDTNSVCPGEYVQQAFCFTSTCPVYGKWTTWSSWSSCDLSCGNGTKSRRRSCSKSTLTDINCVGEETQIQACNTYKCPDCSHSCRNGTLNVDCDRCECSTNITGRVVDSDGFVLSAVRIAESSTPYKILSETGSTGTFTLTSTCSGTELLLRKENYQDTTVTVSTSKLNITMESIVLPYIVSNPNSKYRLSGENATLCCNVKGSPNVSNYEWLKDGVLLNKSQYPSGMSLELLNLTFLDSGQYNCRANSPVGSVQSEKATLSVRDTTGDFCADAYRQKLQNLPDDCLQPDIKTAQYEVGECVSKACRRDNSSSPEACTEGMMSCCGVSGYRSVNVNCTGYQITLLVVTGCSCQSCFSESVNIQGTAVGVDSQLPMKYGEIWVNGALKTKTSKLGKFSVSVSTDVRKLTITAKDTFYNQFLDTTKVLDIPEGLSGTFQITIRMFHASEPVTISSSVENTIYVGNNSDNSSEPVANIVVPPNSFIYQDGSRYNGTVLASLTFLDPTNINTLENIPGVFQFTDNEGNIQDLDTLGVFGLFFEDINGNPLKINGTIEMYLSRQILASDSDAVSKYKIWGLSEVTGRWELISTKSESRKRKRRQADLWLGEIDVQSYTWYNIDAIRGVPSYCYFKTRIYRNYDLSVEVSQLDDYIYLRFPSFRDSTAVFMYGYTQHPMETCYAAICDGSSGFLEIYSWDWNTYERITLIPANPAVHNNIGMDLTAKNLVEYKVSENGRILRLRFAASNDGPFYNDEQTCIQSSTVLNHFRFHFHTSDPDIYTYLHTFNYDTSVLNGPAADAIASKVWYPEFDDNSFRVCYLKVKLSLMGQSSWWEETLTKIRVVSYGGINDAITGELLGIREVTISTTESVCIEYKCSGGLHKGVGGVDFTQIKIFPITPATVKCNVTQDNLRIAYISNVNNVGLLSYSNYAPDFYNKQNGVFQAETDSMQLQAKKKLAYDNCIAAVGYLAVEFTCGFNYDNGWWW